MSAPLMDDTFSALTAFSTIVYYATYPVFLLVSPILALFRFIIFIVAPFWSIAQFVLLPVTYTVYGVLYVILLPFRLRLLERLETMYIYLGIAALIGCCTGALLYYSFAFITSTLNIDTAAETRARQEREREREQGQEGRTTAEDREARRIKQEEESLEYDFPMMSPGQLKQRGKTRKGPAPLPYTMEEDSW